MKPKNLAFAAMTAAVAVLCLLLTVIIPALDLTAAAAAAAAVALTLKKGGFSMGALTFAAAAVLGWLLLPDKTTALYFSLLLGPYPILAAAADRLPGRVLPWCVKLPAEAGLAIGCYYLFAWAFTDLTGSPAQLFGMLAVYLGFIVLFDLTLKKLIGLAVLRLGRWM